MLAPLHTCRPIPHSISSNRRECEKKCREKPNPKAQTFQKLDRARAGYPPPPRHCSEPRDRSRRLLSANCLPSGLRARLVRCRLYPCARRLLARGLAPGSPLAHRSTNNPRAADHFVETVDQRRLPEGRVAPTPMPSVRHRDGAHRLATHVSLAAVLAPSDAGHVLRRPPTPDREQPATPSSARSHWPLTATRLPR